MLGFAHLLHVQGKLDDTRSLYEQALEGFRITLGSSHPKTLVGMNASAMLLQVQGKP